MTYRPDIDGLRALAVLAVIIYHAGLAFPGGYVGVDVFFVISGFLITGLIVRDLDRGTFSMASFWKRRILRIWPASFAMVFAVLAVGVVVMAPQDLAETGRDAVSQICMTANITFWRTVDYFRPDSELRPLLHCWSLAVEEQFYVFLPPLLVLLWGFGRRVAWILLIASTVASFALSVALLDSNPWATFYLLPTRAWELAIGSIVALLPRAKFRAGPIEQIASLVGLAAVVAPMLLYTNRTPFPGSAALPVCLGTAVLLVTNGSSINRLLSTAPVRGIGLVSYSLYLWHWPVLSFSRYVEGLELSARTTAIALVATAILGVLSWRFIEQPFRNMASRLSFRRSVSVAAVFAAMGAIMAVVIWQTGGLPMRFDARELEFASPPPSETRWSGSGVPMAIGAPAEQAGAVKLLLIGDSHGLAISGAFDEAARSRGVAGWAALRHGVLPIPVTNAQSADPLWTQSMVEWAGESKVTDVVLCARWMGYLKAEIESRCGAGAPIECEDRVAELFASHLSTVHQTLGESGIRLWFLSEVPDAPHPMFAAVRARVLGTPLPETGIARATHEANQRVVEKVLSDPRLVGIRVWDLSTPFFEQGGDGAQILSEQGVFYVDGNHLSTVGASFLVPHLSRLFSSMTGDEHEDDAQPVPSEGRIGDAAAE